MSGDGKIGLQVGGVVRMGAVRRIASDAATPARASAPVAAATDSAPATRLIGLATELAGDTAPVDGARVAELRSAIANGSYRVDARQVAQAMLDFHRGGGDA